MLAQLSEQYDIIVEGKVQITPFNMMVCHVWNYGDEFRSCFQYIITEGKVQITPFNIYGLPEYCEDEVFSTSFQKARFSDLHSTLCLACGDEVIILRITSAVDDIFTFSRNFHKFKSDKLNIRIS